MAFYPAAWIVNFKVIKMDDTLLSSLLSMERDDHEFAQLLLTNHYL
jgi:hypothetical protein